MRLNLEECNQIIKLLDERIAVGYNQQLFKLRSKLIIRRDSYLDQQLVKFDKAMLKKRMDKKLKGV